MPSPSLFRTTTAAAGSLVLPLARIRAARYTTVEKGRLVEQWFDAFRNKKIVEQDIIAASQFNLMGNTMDHPVYNGTRLPENGTELPPAWHLAYFPPRVLEEDLSSDGYEQEWKPPSPFNHRMWAGGELKWNPDNPLRVGDAAQMESSLRDVQFRPAGRRGDSVFIWVDKHISNAKGWAMTESRCWVYIDDKSSSSPAPIKEKSPMQDKDASSSSSKPQSSEPSPPSPQPDFSLDLTPSPILLFRFSSLTFNSHLIHYDHLYATNVEHHRGCLVHGPMSFWLMVNQLNDHLKKNNAGKVIKSFKYRCKSPLVVNEPLKVQGKLSSDHPDQFELWVADHQGKQAVKGTAIVG